MYGRESPFLDTALNDKTYSEHLPGNKITREDKGLLYKKSIGFVRKKSEVAVEVRDARTRENVVKESGKSIGNEKKTKHAISLPLKDSVAANKENTSAENVPVVARTDAASVHDKRTEPNARDSGTLTKNRMATRSKTVTVATEISKGTEASSHHKMVSRSMLFNKRKSSRKVGQGKRVFVPADDAEDAYKATSRGAKASNANDGSEWGASRSTPYSSPYGMPVFGDRSEHGMLSRLLDQNSLGFGTNQEKQDKELTIQEIEKYSEASSKLPPGFTVPTGGISDFSDTRNLDVTVGAIADSDQRPQDMEQSNIYQKSSIPGHTLHKNTYLAKRRKSIDTDKLRSDMRNARFRVPRSNRAHRHRSSVPYDSADFPAYEKFPEYPKISSVFPPISTFPLADRFPTFPPFSREGNPEEFPHFARFPEFEKSPDLDDEEDDVSRAPPPPPLPPALVSREHTNQREAAPRDEPEVIDEPAPIREPAPIPEIAPIPELAPIREIPPISENREPQPKPLDPKKTFEKAESNGGVKKSKSTR